MKDFFKKLGSRKFLMALISVISGIMTMANCGDSVIQFVCSLVMIIVPTITYIITEGVLDYTGIGLALDQIIEAIQTFIDSRQEVENKQDNNDILAEEDEVELQEGTLEITSDGIAVVD